MATTGSQWNGSNALYMGNLQATAFLRKRNVPIGTQSMSESFVSPFVHSKSDISLDYPYYGLLFYLYYIVDVCKYNHFR
jgi:hypothetical protein